MCFFVRGATLLKLLHIDELNKQFSPAVIPSSFTIDLSTPLRLGKLYSAKETRLIEDSLKDVSWRKL
jgi:hypothetical protein